jgi:hypothetical protein
MKLFLWYLIGILGFWLAAGIGCLVIVTVGAALGDVKDREPRL